MTKGNSVEIIDVDVTQVAQPQQSKPTDVQTKQPVEEQPVVDISLQELAYLYQVFVNANIPGNDLEFAAELKRKLKQVLSIPQ